MQNLHAKFTEMQLTEKTKADDANLMYPNQRRFHPIPAVKFFTAMVPSTNKKVYKVVELA